jgi:adenylyltransferase/sulfurtransferase
MPKVESAKEFIGWLNPMVNVVTYHDGLNASNAAEIIRQYDIVVDAVDIFLHVIF